MKRAARLLLLTAQEIRNSLPPTLPSDKSKAIAWQKKINKATEYTRAAEILAAMPVKRQLAGLPPDKDSRARELLGLGMLDHEIAAELRIGRSRIGDWRRLHCIPPNCPRGVSPYWRKPKETNLRVKRLLLVRVARAEIAKVCDVSVDYIQEVRKSLDGDPRLLPIGRRSPAKSRLGFSNGKQYRNIAPERRKAALIAWADGKIDKEIAEEIGCSVSRIWEWRAKYALPTNYDGRGRTKPKPKAQSLKAPITPRSNDLYSRIADAVGRRISPDLAADAIQDMVVAVLEGELSEDRIEAEASRYSNRVISRFASSFGPRSLDEEITEDGVKLGDLLVDPMAELAIFEAVERSWAARAAA